MGFGMKHDALDYDIIFIIPPNNGIDYLCLHNETSVERVFPPLGVLSMTCSFFKLYEIINVTHIDFNIKNNVKNYAEDIHNRIGTLKARNRAIFCISIMMSSSYSFIDPLVTFIKDNFQDSIIVCGGAHSSSTVQELFNAHREIDYIVCGEGEESLPKLYSAIHGGTTPDIQGVHSRSNIKRSAQGGYERCPFPADINVDYKYYPKITILEDYCGMTSNFSLSKKKQGDRAFAIMASRGCPGNCSFCAAATVHGRRPRWRNLDNVRGEMQFLYDRYGVTRFYLMDDNFVPKASTLDLFKMLGELAIPEKEIVIQNMSVNHTDYEIIDAIAGARISYIPLAIETGAVSMQKKIGKNCDLEKARQLVRYAQSKGLQVRCFYIIGFPGETIAEMRKTIEFAQTMAADWSSFNVAVPLPGTRMYREFREMRVIDDSPETWKTANIRERFFDTPEITASAIKEMAYRANLSVNFLNNPLLAKRMFIEAEVIFTNFTREMDFHVFAFESLRQIYLKTGRKSEAQDTARHMERLLAHNPLSSSFLRYLDMLPDDIRPRLEEASRGAPKPQPHA